ncbi:MAG: cytochrome c biogenesis protein CcsA [Deinococcota bacterium]|nr:cytochrome c biogenesis protein CcsA [Deinococcota bacterium]
MKRIAANSTLPAAPSTKRPLWLNVFGLMVLGLFGYGFYMAIFASPPDVNQGELIRIMYAHVAVAWVCFLAVFISAAFGLLYLWRGRKIHDVIAVASAELALFFAALIIINGMIWSRPTFNTWWTWDAKLTATAVLFLLLAGYVIVRGLIDDPERRGRVAAVIMLITAADVPIIYFAADWWRTLHPPLTIRLDGAGVSMDSRMLFVLLFNVGVGALIFTYLMLERIRIGRLEARLEKTEDDRALSGEVVRV